MGIEDAVGNDYYKTLPSEYYFSEAWFERDLDRVFSKSWLMAGYASQIPRPGDFFTFELATANVIVTRGAGGEISAFHNVCRHRGTRFCTERSGHVKRGFVCRFHGWSYGLDGSLKGAPQMPSDFDKTQWPAKPVAIEVWNGMIFLNLSGDEERSVSHIMRNVDISAYDLAHTKVAADVEMVWNCNWKLISEGFQECYHCSINHPELCQVLIPDANFEGLQAKPVTDGSDDEFLIFTADRSYAVREGMATFSMDGKYLVKRLLGSAVNPPSRIGQIDWFPNFQAFLQPDFAHIETFLPLSPTKSAFRASFLVHEDAIEGEDYDVHELTHMYVKTLEQDTALVEAAQLGVSSPAHTPGPYHPVLESAAIQYFQKYERVVNAG
jgi:Rieske 2Fe-2S family protein